MLKEYMGNEKLGKDLHHHSFRHCGLFSKVWFPHCSQVLSMLLFLEAQKVLYFMHWLSDLGVFMQIFLKKKKPKTKARLQISKEFQRF